MGLEYGMEGVQSKMKKFQFISVVCLSLTLAFFASGCASKKSGGSAGMGSDSAYDQYGTGASKTGGIGLGTLARVHFGFDESSLTEDARETLQSNAKIIMDKPSMRVLVEGHCDERGSNEYNIALGERRANAVIAYLTTLGVPRTRLEMKSWGEERPLDPGKSESAYKMNRRAEFVILKK